MLPTPSTAGLKVTISRAREQLRIFILKNELQRVAANRLSVLQIRATAKTTGRMDVDAGKEVEDDLFEAAKQLIQESNTGKVEVCVELS